MPRNGLRLSAYRSTSLNAMPVMTVAASSRVRKPSGRLPDPGHGALADPVVQVFEVPAVDPHFGNHRLDEPQLQHRAAARLAARAPADPPQVGIGSTPRSQQSFATKWISFGSVLRRLRNRAWAR